MRSLWTVSYVGPHTATTIKKLERLLDIQAIDLQKERYVWDHENLERAAFFIDHGALEWPAVVISLLQKTSVLAVDWQCSGDAMQTLSASVAHEHVRTSFKDRMPSGLREISWMVRADQQYPTGMLTTGSTVQRW